MKRPIKVKQQQQQHIVHGLAELERSHTPVARLFKKGAWLLHLIGDKAPHCIDVGILTSEAPGSIDV